MRLVADCKAGSGLPKGLSLGSGLQPMHTGCCQKIADTVTYFMPAATISCEHCADAMHYVQARLVYTTRTIYPCTVAPILEIRDK